MNNNFTVSWSAREDGKFDICQGFETLHKAEIKVFKIKQAAKRGENTGRWQIVDAFCNIIKSSDLE